jgi:hypothetical protein
MTFRNDQAIERFSIAKRNILQWRHGGGRFVQQSQVIHQGNALPFKSTINVSTGAIVIASVTLMGPNKIVHSLM